MGTRERRDRERNETRKRILDAARELFATQGYDAVTMRKIAEKIEYTPTAIYFHFKDKDSLIAELCAGDFLAFSRLLFGIGSIADPIERLRRLADGYVSFAIDYPNHYRLLFMTPHPSRADEDRVRRGVPEEDAYRFLQLTVAQAIAEGRFRPELTDADLVAQLLWAALHGVVSLHIAKCNESWIEWRPIRETTRLMVDALTRGLSRQEA